MSDIQKVMDELRRKRDNSVSLGQCAPRLLAALKAIAEEGTDSPEHEEAIEAIREAESKIL